MMVKRIYVVRHCQAEGQSPEAKLTKTGKEQAFELARLFDNLRIDRIISSPYKRAIQSIDPIVTKRNINIETNSNLTERILSNKPLEDWLVKLKQTFENMALKLEGGESSQEAMNRIVRVVEDVFQSTSDTTIIVTHGNLMALLLKYYDENFGFEDWRSLSNPDVYLLKMTSDEVTYEQVWIQTRL
ncbi:histidine phosphatase family protein [Ornithinibacillus xuwenensis]|uniref:Histidine phosphatase family protein n=1 Tax=Ornithinibacillus xuwenensis TaxID=3144668 RepID=A0ABU9XDG7_9BACI